MQSRLIIKMVLQSYLSALILKYAKLYIKNIEANLRLTLWGGDVVLNNVELRLDGMNFAILHIWHLQQRSKFEPVKIRASQN